MASLVSLAGYTSSGKSTLFNVLAKEGVPAGIGLFTTLSTVTRAVNFDGKKVLLTDTVGFIDRLPLILIEAFRATLEETIFSSAITLIVDISEPISEVERKLHCCLDTIREMGASRIPLITVLNKIDLISKMELNEKLCRLNSLAPNSIPISALYETNLGELKDEISRHLESYFEATLTLPVNDSSMQLISWIHDQTNVLEENYGAEQAKLVVEAPTRVISKLKAHIEKLGGSFQNGR